MGQGYAAIWCWIEQAVSNNNYDSIGLTIFADVEINTTADPTYWYVGSNAQPLNQEQINENTQTLVGFLDAVGRFTGVSPGVYVSSSTVSQLFPGINLATGCSIYECPDPYQPAIWWEAGGCSAAGALTTTYPNVPAYQEVQQEMANIERLTSSSVNLGNGETYFFPGPCSLLRLSPALWQYAISNINDFDIADNNQVLQSTALPEQRECKTILSFLQRLSSVEITFIQSQCLWGRFNLERWVLE